jgi:hypothetical protein
MRSILPPTASPALADDVLRRCLADFPHVRLTVTGECMAPALRPGDTALVAGRRPRLGEVALVRLPAGLRLHRLVWGRPGAASLRRTKADRSPFWDPPGASADLLGTVVGLERDGEAIPAPPRLAAALGSVAGGLAFRVRRRFGGARGTGGEREEG